MDEIQLIVDIKREPILSNDNRLVFEEVPEIEDKKER